MKNIENITQNNNENKKPLESISKSKILLFSLLISGILLTGTGCQSENTDYIDLGTSLQEKEDNILSNEELKFLENYSSNDLLEMILGNDFHSSNTHEFFSLYGDNCLIFYLEEKEYLKVREILRTDKSINNISDGFYCNVEISNILLKEANKHIIFIKNSKYKEEILKTKLHEIAHFTWNSSINFSEQSLEEKTLNELFAQTKNSDRIEYLTNNVYDKEIESLFFVQEFNVYKDLDQDFAKKIFQDFIEYIKNNQGKSDIEIINGLREKFLNKK